VNEVAGPLAGISVFVPRSAERASRLLSALRGAGAEPVAAPLVSIDAPDDPAPMDDAAATLAGGGYDWVAVTSGFAVDGLCDAAGRIGRTLGALVDAGRTARPGSTRIAAVGDATAAALAGAGVAVDFVPTTAQSAAGMLTDWPPTDPGASVLLPQSDLAEPDLAEGLTGRGWQPRAVVAYRNSPAPALPPTLVADLASGRIGAVVLTSGSAARRLAAQTTLPASTLLCCIGPRTAEVVASLGLTVGVVANRPSPESIVAALTTALRPTPGLSTGLPPMTTPTSRPTTHDHEVTP